MLPSKIVQPLAAVLAVWVLPLTQAAGATPVLSDCITHSYLDLAKESAAIRFTSRERDQVRKQLERDRNRDVDRLKQEEKKLDGQIADLRKQLDSLNRESSADTPAAAETRLRVHCELLRLEKLRADKRIEREHGVKIAYENKIAKLDFIEHWPARQAGIAAEIEAGRARQRRFGDVDDIGVRLIGKDQEKDIQLGDEAVRQMKAQGLFPPEIEDAKAKAYVQGIANRIAANSDVKVPVKLTLLRSPEINAFALPGGFLFVNSGLIERADNEAELAGVIAHELAHVSARHGATLTKRANIAAAVYQMAQIAILVGTGGYGTIGTYYLMQAGFLGLGMVLDLSLLGVSRDFEAEADQLGAQYAWKAGYDPRGFISFFDTMAKEKGYVTSASFFRTHPPFLERIMSTMSEIEYLPYKDGLALDSSAFRKFKADFAALVRTEEKRQPGAPTLKTEPECPPAPPDADTTSGIPLRGPSQFSCLEGDPAGR